MDKDTSKYIEESFLKPFLSIPEVTDISYNGTALFYMTSERGRLKGDLAISSDTVGDFLRQVANLSEKQFSYSSPILDVSFGRYRLNATYKSIARSSNEKVFTFDLRIESFESKIDKDEGFFLGNSRDLVLEMLRNRGSIIVGGETSTGKTELEKWLLTKMPDNTRVIVIDNIEELDIMSIPHLDLTVWISNDKNETSSFPKLIRNALRNNPDYIVVAEGRGGEMYDALVSATSGHSLISSIHALNLESMPNRIVKLCMQGDKRSSPDELRDDVSKHIKNYIFLKREQSQDGRIHRFVDEIGTLNDDGTMEVLFRRDK